MDLDAETEPLLDRDAGEASSSQSTTAGITVYQEIQTPLEVPALTAHETHHIFISYSSTDAAWARGLIQKLEATLPELKVCFHERDFMPGKTIIENMVESIQGSQKILLFLSPDFVQSRWCLLEANLSIFRDCIERKPVIPVMLQTCSVPLHLTHLTYLDASDVHFFKKVSKVICTPNHQMQNATMVPYNPPSLYNGKALLTLHAVNEGFLLKRSGGIFSDVVPDQLSMVSDDPVSYRASIQMINEISSRTVPCSPAICFFVTCACLLVTLISSFFIILNRSLDNSSFESERDSVGYMLLALIVFTIVALGSCIYHYTAKLPNVKLLEMSQAAGLANYLLQKSSLLMGCASRVELHFVYMSLEGCRKEFADTFGESSPSAEEMFQRALHYFSSDYACCVAKMYFHFSWARGMPGHWDKGPCFCQFVSHCVREGSWYWNASSHSERRVRER
ncbi:uncharacterized protein LOC109285361 [Alligator mississippiensis]|uniref:uncharacterized protein LOC109285361 n=1 Tax=Alligator mississippiensis TaxID=8496 RepID=UPI002877B3A7|nr:uncharacterized protein LOC109285361 [Alligator mississippiensis]XP_059582737.1 uncharacterized protein LOC109285361 [Alligator mississippiensis]XP_059582738.1 uncharacterized protein LOC109285361 [Alligator mississippiensis]XP_059582739.1 uncharacterized protein LOC109285361 [Alligator mississippiensis]